MGEATGENPTGNREQNLAAAAAHTGMVVVESPAGFRAAHFVTELLEAHTKQGRTVADLDDSDDLDTNLAADVATIYAPLTSGLRAWRDTVASRHRHHRPTIIVLPVGVPADSLLGDEIPAVVISANELKMDANDIAKRDHELGGVGEAEVVEALSDGWPEMVDATLTHARSQTDRTAALADAARPVFQRRVLNRHTHRFTNDQVGVLAQLAHFQTFSEIAATAVGGDDFVTDVLLKAPGVIQVSSGMFEFVAPVQQSLTTSAALDASVASQVALLLIADGQLVNVCQTLFQAGMHEDVAKLLVGLPGNVVDLAQQQKVLAILRVIDGFIPTYQRLALVQARTLSNLGRPGEAVVACESVLDSDDDDVGVEAAIELLYLQFTQIEWEGEGEGRAAELAAEVPTGGPLATRLRETEAAVMQQSVNPGVVNEGIERALQVADEWEMHGDRLRAAKALRLAALNGLLHLGRYRDGQQVLERAVVLTAQDPFAQSVTLVAKAMFDGLCGDVDAARQCLQRTRGFAANAGLGWLDYPCEVAEGAIAFWEDDPAAIPRAWQRAVSALGPMIDQHTGAFVHAIFCSLAASAGDVATARRIFAHLDGREDEKRVEIGCAELIMVCREGNPERGEQILADMDEAGILPVTRRGRLRLEITLARFKATGVRELDVWRSIAESAIAAGQEPALMRLAPELMEVAPTAEAIISVRTLGGLLVTAPGGVVELPAGHPTTLVGFVAAHEGSVPVVSAIDVLWPDRDEQGGRKLMKNVFTKTTDALGKANITRTTETIAFGPNVRMDTDEFAKLANKAVALIAVDAAAAVDDAVTALNMYGGPLLPESDDERIVEMRDAYARKAMVLYDFLAGQPGAPIGSWFADTKRKLANNVEA